VVTIFGDAILPRGGALSLASLIAIMGRFRIGEGVVRTAMSRLVQDGFFERTSQGRNSFFSISEDAAELFANASETIYRAPRLLWDGAASLCLIDGRDRALARAGLLDKGFAQLTPDLLIAIPAKAGPVPENTILFPASPSLADARRLVARAWPCEDVAARYRIFVDLFDPLVEEGAFDGAGAFIARTLLIHYYRRAALRDPGLPLSLRPEDWPAKKAWALCSALYGRYLMDSEDWLSENAANARGPLPPPDPDLLRRFDAMAEP
jgi:phenylacetic acid degradation operon negative regulatory protein